MSGPWLHVVGLGAEGMAGLGPAARAALEAAEVIVGGARHHALTDGLAAERIAWPSPFDALIDRLAALRGRPVAVLATGDPLWFSVGEQIAAAFPEDERRLYPAVSAFQHAACRMGWPMAGLSCLSVHGRPIEAVMPHLQPGARLLLLADGAETPARLGRLLVERGMGESRVTALAAMGAPEEGRLEGRASDWAEGRPAPAFHTLAVEVAAGPEAPLAPATPGLDDALFEHDGTMTKREVRAVTLARLMPMPGALLWDVGAGAGSVGIEWMRAAPGARAVAIEPRPDRRARIAENARRLGTPGLEILAGEAPGALAGLPPPDAVFLGGGLSDDAAAKAIAALRRPGRLVANAVTLEAEARLASLHAAHGGELVRIAISRAEPLGRVTGWRPAMPVTQWSLVLR